MKKVLLAAILVVASVAFAASEKTKFDYRLGLLVAHPEVHRALGQAEFSGGSLSILEEAVVSDTAEGFHGCILVMRAGGDTQRPGGLLTADVTVKSHGRGGVSYEVHDVKFTPAQSREWPSCD